jgi:prophage tail gpP-like protein
MTFEIRVNDQIFTDFETARVVRSLDTNSGAFSFSSSNTAPVDYPVRAGDAVQILINGVSKIVGFCDSVSGSMTTDGHTITAQGRDNTCDLIDSSVPDSAKTIPSPISLKAFAETLISSLGLNIPVVNSIGSSVIVGDAVSDDIFAENTGITADSGRRCMDFLTDFARKKQVYIIADGAGRMLIYRPGKTNAPGALIHRRDGDDQNTIKSYSVSFDHGNRFRTYKVSSQDNLGSFDTYDDESVARGGTATDRGSRPGRYMEFQGEEAMGDAESARRATEEANIRKARAVNYTTVVAGVSPEFNSRNLWDIGQLVSVSDDFAGVRGTFLIREVEYVVNLSRGTETRITVAPPDAYNVRIGNAQDDRLAVDGPRLQRLTPTQRLAFIR